LVDRRKAAVHASLFSLEIIELLHATGGGCVGGAAFHRVADSVITENAENGGDVELCAFGDLSLECADLCNFDVDVAASVSHALCPSERLHAPVTLGCTSAQDHRRNYRGHNKPAHLRSPSDRFGEPILFNSR
jgi:hypothetical protein